MSKLDEARQVSLIAYWMACGCLVGAIIGLLLIMVGV